jgi:hypothetical protein
MLAYAGLVLVDFVTRSAADRACPYPGQAVKKATSLLRIGEASDPVPTPGALCNKVCHSSSEEKQ